MASTPEEYYISYFKRAKESEKTVKEKILDCFNTLKDNSKSRYQLEVDIHFCCQTVLDDFYSNCFFSSVNELKDNHEYFYKLAGETYLMYVDLITYPRKISQDFYHDNP